MKSIMLIDDHRIVLEATAQLLRSHFPNSEVHVADSCRDGLSLARLKPIDVAVFDLEMPGRSGLELVTELRLIQPELLPIVLSMHTNMVWVKRMLQEGAKGYVSKASASEELIAAIKGVSQGEVYLSKDITLQFVHSLTDKSLEMRTHEKLTKRELEILIQLGRHKELKDIAGDLGLSPKTVSVHKFNIYQKTGLGSSHQIREYCQKAGLIEQDFHPPA